MYSLCCMKWNIQSESFIALLLHTYVFPCCTSPLFFFFAPLFRSLMQKMFYVEITWWLHLLLITSLQFWTSYSLTCPGKTYMYCVSLTWTYTIHDVRSLNVRSEFSISQNSHPLHVAHRRVLGFSWSSICSPLLRIVNVFSINFVCQWQLYTFYHLQGVRCEQNFPGQHHSGGAMVRIRVQLKKTKSRPCEIMEQCRPTGGFTPPSCEWIHSHWL